MKPADNVAVLILASVWGAAFLFIDVIVEETDPLTIVAGRMIFATGTLIAVALATGRRLPPRSMWGLLLLLGLTNNVLPFGLIFWAQEEIDGGLAATLIATMPLFTFIIASSVARRRPDAVHTAGIIVGFVGAAVVLGADLTDLKSTNTVAQLAVILGALSYAVSTVIARERLRGDAIVLAGGQMIGGMLLAIPLALVVDRPLDLRVSAEAWLAWLALGVVSSAFAYIIYFSLVQRLTATQVSLVTYVVPIVATVLGWVVLDDHIGANLYIGLALILIGMMAVNGNFDAFLRRKRDPDSAHT